MYYIKSYNGLFLSRFDSGYPMWSEYYIQAFDKNGLEECLKKHIGLLGDFEVYCLDGSWCSTYDFIKD